MSDTDELRTILQDSVTRLLTDLATKDVLDAAERGTWPAGIWQALEEHGLTRVLVAEEHGGSGAGWSDAYVLLHAAGRFAAPVPFAESVLGGWLLSRAGLDVPEGPLTVAPVRRGEALRLDGGRLSGTVSRVPWGARAGHIVAVAGERVCLVRGEAARTVADVSAAAEPRDTLTFEAAPAVATAPAPDGLNADRLFELGAMLRTAQMAGGLEFVLEQSVQYANERSQFGRAIGKFQAVQQNLAALATEAAAAGMAAATAFAAAESRHPAFEIAIAKARVGEAAGKGAAIAHQVHGAIGFTYEHALHFVTRRLWSWRSEFGNDAFWQERLGRLVAGRGADALWPAITAA